MNGLPKYVWDLLEAAKFAHHPPSNATAHDLVSIHERLGDAVREFEARMPLQNGCAMVSEVAGIRPDSYPNLGLDDRQRAEV